MRAKYLGTQFTYTWFRVRSFMSGYGAVVMSHKTRMYGNLFSETSSRTSSPLLYLFCKNSLVTMRDQERLCKCYPKPMQTASYVWDYACVQKTDLLLSAILVQDSRKIIRVVSTCVKLCQISFHCWVGMGGWLTRQINHINFWAL